MLERVTVDAKGVDNCVRVFAAPAVNFVDLDSYNELAKCKCCAGQWKQ